MSFSCEHYRTKAYDDDVRWRIVWQREALGLCQREVARNLCVDRSTVSRIVCLFHATGTVSKKKYPSENAFRKLTDPAQLLILHLVVNKPGIYLHEIQRELLLMLMVEVNISTICRFLQANGFSHQKLIQVALQRDDYFRQRYMFDASLYQPEMLLFLDETGADQRSCLRKFERYFNGAAFNVY